MLVRPTFTSQVWRRTSHLACMARRAEWRRGDANLEEREGQQCQGFGAAILPLFKLVNTILSGHN